MRIYWINSLKSGSIGMMPRPRGNDWLSDEIAYLKQYEVDHVVSLLESHEMAELELEMERTYCEQQDISYSNFPIVDCAVPYNIEAFNAFVEKLVEEVKNGNKIVVHCRMGIGRTSTLVATILIKLGLFKADVFEYLSEIRTLEVPDAEKQKDWVIRNFLN
ncbi:MAG: protein-tyrosine phosphatase [Crocinitomix sp.]|jgi:protein-tyrosine phosphatase